MQHPLTPHERSMLLGLEESLRGEDPALARSLQRLRPPLGRRFSPQNWPAPVFLVLGVLFLIAGISLGVGSSVLGGLFLLAMSGARSARVRRALVQMVAEGNKPR